MTATPTLTEKVRYLKRYLAEQGQSEWSDEMCDDLTNSIMPSIPVVVKGITCYHRNGTWQISLNTNQSSGWSVKIGEDFNKTFNAVLNLKR